MLLISQGNIENSRSKERGGRAHTLGDGLPGTISKQLALGMSGSCCKASKAIDQGVRQLGITWCGGWGREGRQTPCPPWWATAGNCHTTPRSSGWRGRRTSSCPSRGMSAVWWGLTCFWRWCIRLSSLRSSLQCKRSLWCLWEMVCIFEFFHCCVGQCLWSRAQWVQLGNFDSFYFGQKRRRSSWSDQTGRLQTLKKEQGLVAEAEKLFWAFRKRIDDAQFGASINGGKGKSITSDADEGGAMRNR